jgi:thiamine-phosphate pyrophosphorylase
MNSLYVTDRSAVGDARFEETLSALSGAPGVAVQLREKEISDRECLEWAARCRRLLGATTPLFVNRRLDIALAGGADGVHLPASGLPLRLVRHAAPRGLRVGVSTHSPAEARLSIEEGADLVLLGPIFETPSKRGYGPPLGPESLAELPPRSGHACEVLAIGGISEESLSRLEPFRDRIHGVAGIRFFQESADPRAVAERIARR